MPHGDRLHLYVWPDRFLYVGPSMVTTPHRNHAAVWLAARGGQMQVTLNDGVRLIDNAVYLPPGTLYASDQQVPAIAALFWEPESESYRKVAERFSDQPRAFRCPLQGGDAWQMLADPHTSLTDASRLLADLFAMGGRVEELPVALDPRIEEALAQLRVAPQNYEHLEDLAAQVHLSPSRFAHLFKESVGVPVRRYVLWMKMRHALDHALAGHSLTAAALTAGFADSAHLSRTVRAMFGMAPEFLFRQRQRLVVHR
jgi:AraC-like DNA-binding protein